MEGRGSLNTIREVVGWGRIPLTMIIDFGVGGVVGMILR